MVVRRVLICLGLRRSVLRRPVDLAEAWLTVALVTTVVVIGPILAWRAGQAVYRRGVDDMPVNVGEHFQTTAVLQQDSVVYSPDPTVSTQQVPVLARWNGPDGLSHTGLINAEINRRAGSVVAIWVDGAGNFIGRPPRIERAINNGIGVGMAIEFGLAVGLTVLWLTAHRLLELRRLARWQTQWALVEPGWSGRQNC
jgi:hypothetical protein